MKKIIIGSDHAGFKLKEILKSFLEKNSFKIKDVGTFSPDSCDYPYFACAVAKGVAQGRYKRGLLVCKTGIGNSIVANRFAGVRAALCYNLKACRLSREHNDANILILSSAFVPADLAKRMTTVWLKTRFKGGRHRRRLDQIKKIERSFKR